MVNRCLRALYRLALTRLGEIYHFAKREISIETLDPRMGEASCVP